LELRVEIGWYDAIKESDDLYAKERVSDLCRKSYSQAQAQA